MMNKSGILALGILVMATGAVAASPPATETAKPPKEKKVCKSEKITGSLTRVRRVCMTQREWNELAQRTSRDVDELVRQSGRNDGGGAAPGGI